MTLEEMIQSGLRASNYYRAGSNNFYCEVRCDDSDHRNEVTGTTEIFWRLNRPSPPGPVFICDNCYIELLRVGENQPRIQVKMGNRDLIKRKIPGSANAN